MRRSYAYLLFSALLLTSCVSKKEFAGLQSELKVANDQLAQCDAKIVDYEKRINTCEIEKQRLNSEISNLENSLNLRQEQIDDFKEQISDMRGQRDKQLEQVGDLTVLSQSANENIKETLSQLEARDDYIKYLQAAKTKADSINLALAVNLKGVLNQGIADEDVEIMVDKTVVMINLSDKMLYSTGSASIKPRAKEILGKIAKIIESRPELEVMVEGYTDDVPISTSCMKDNWDLSVKRATSVVRVLQEDFSVDPNRLIAAGRGEFNAMATNETADGRATNRRTRIIIMPKINEFYDLLNPANVPE